LVLVSFFSRSLSRRGASPLAPFFRIHIPQSSLFFFVCSLFFSTPPFLGQARRWILVRSQGTRPHFFFFFPGFFSLPTFPPPPHTAPLFSHSHFVPKSLPPGKFFSKQILSPPRDELFHLGLVDPSRPPRGHPPLVPLSLLVFIVFCEQSHLWSAAPPSRFLGLPNKPFCDSEGFYSTRRV